MSQAVKSPITAVRACPFCKASGHCGKCDGTGVRVSTSRGRFHQRVKQESDCHACDGSGVCQLCHGSGGLATESS